MRLVKMLLFAALAVGWWQLWHARDAVVSAYVDDQPTLALELDGMGAVLAETESSPSPFELQPASAERAPTFLPLGESEPVADTDVSVSVVGGTARVSGVVRLPDGTPVAGATVWIERFTSEGSGLAETVSGDDGTWSAAGLRGGRLRIRAFAPNQLASVDPAVLIVTTGGTAQLDLGVITASPGVQFEMFGPPGVAIGTAGTVAVVLSREAVDANGRLVQSPVVGQVVTASITGGRLLSDDAVFTDAGGAARYLIACDAESTLVANVDADEADAVLALPSCMSAELLAELEAAAAAERAAEQESIQIGPIR